MTACALCARDTPTYQLHILAGDWYCPDCYGPVAAEYETPEAQARRDAEEAEFEAAWPRALSLLDALGCTADRVADGDAWSALCNDARALLAMGWPDGIVAGLVALYTRGDTTRLPASVAARYILAASAPGPRGQLDLFAPARPTITPRKDFAVRWTGPCGPLRAWLARPEIQARPKPHPDAGPQMPVLPPP